MIHINDDGKEGHVIYDSSSEFEKRPVLRIIGATVTDDDANEETIITITSGGASHIAEHQWVSPYSYCGTATSGSATSDSVWDITRIQVASDGSTTIKHALSVKWDDRLTAIYT